MIAQSNFFPPQVQLMYLEQSHEYERTHNVRDLISYLFVFSQRPVCFSCAIPYVSC